MNRTNYWDCMGSESSRFRTLFRLFDSYQLLGQTPPSGTSLRTKNTEKFYLKQRRNIILLNVDQRIYHVARQAIWEPLGTTGSGRSLCGLTIS